MAHGEIYPNPNNWICGKCGQYGHQEWYCWQYDRPPTISEMNSQEIGVGAWPISFKQGWQCPECKTCYNPDVESCDCSQDVEEVTLARFSRSDIGHKRWWVTDSETSLIYDCLTAQDALALCDLLNDFDLALRKAEELQGKV